MANSGLDQNDPVVLRLQELERETDFEFVLELIDIYMNETPKQIKAISSALAAKDYPALTIAAHTLKGSSLNLGAKILGSHCLKLEEVGRKKGEILQSLNTKEIENEFERTKELFLAFKNSKH